MKWLVNDCFSVLMSYKYYNKSSWVIVYFMLLTHLCIPHWFKGVNEEICVCACMCVCLYKDLLKNIIGCFHLVLVFHQLFTVCQMKKNNTRVKLEHGCPRRQGNITQTYTHTRAGSEHTDRLQTAARHEHKPTNIVLWVEIDFPWAQNTVDVFPLMWSVLLNYNTGWHRSFPLSLASYQALVLLTELDWEGETERVCLCVTMCVCESLSQLVCVCVGDSWGLKRPWERKMRAGAQ